jgi:hypothetical protein
MSLSTARSILPEHGETGATIKAAQTLFETVDCSMCSMGSGFGCNELAALTVDPGFYIFCLRLYAGDSSLKLQQVDSHAVAFVKLEFTYGRIIDNMAATPFVELMPTDIASQADARAVFAALFPGATRVSMACVYKVTGPRAK